MSILHDIKPYGAVGFLVTNAEMDEIHISDVLEEVIFGDYTWFESNGKYYVVFKNINPINTSRKQIESLKEFLLYEGLINEGDESRICESYNLRGGIRTN